MFITQEDYRVVIGENALKVVSQASQEIRDNAELEACEEIAGYLRPKYDTETIFAAQGDERNRLVVMYAADIALYHMTAAMPQKMGSEIRKERYERAIKWLENHPRPAARHRQRRHTLRRPSHFRITTTVKT